MRDHALALCFVDWYLAATEKSRIQDEVWKMEIQTPLIAELLLLEDSGQYWCYSEQVWVPPIA